MLLDILQNLQENTCTTASFLIKLQASRLRHLACNSIKKGTLAQLLSCEFCKISKNNFYRTPLGDCFCSFFFFFFFDDAIPLHSFEFQKKIVPLLNLFLVVFTVVSFFSKFSQLQIFSRKVELCTKWNHKVIRLN